MGESKKTLIEFGGGKVSSETDRGETVERYQHDTMEDFPGWENISNEDIKNIRQTILGVMEFDEKEEDIDIQSDEYIEDVRVDAEKLAADIIAKKLRDPNEVAKLFIEACDEYELLHSDMELIRNVLKALRYEEIDSKDSNLNFSKITPENFMVIKKNPGLLLDCLYVLLKNNQKPVMGHCIKVTEILNNFLLISKETQKRMTLQEQVDLVSRKMRSIFDKMDDQNKDFIGEQNVNILHETLKLNFDTVEKHPISSSDYNGITTFKVRKEGLQDEFLIMVISDESKQLGSKVANLFEATLDESPGFRTFHPAVVPCKLFLKTQGIGDIPKKKGEAMSYTRLLGWKKGFVENDYSEPKGLVEDTYEIVDEEIVKEKKPGFLSGLYNRMFKK